MSDKYFKDKAEECFNEILGNFNDKGSKLYTSEIEHIIYMALKEVARDQRYACIEEITINCISNNLPENFQYRKVKGLLHNAEIKDKEINTVSELHKCIGCGKTGEDVTFGPDPYSEDVNGDSTTVWECTNCRNISASDI